MADAQATPQDLGEARPYVLAEAPAEATRIDWLDMLLVVVFLLGLYTNYTIPISQKVPLPSAPSGFAGLILLWRHRHGIRPAAVGGLMAVLLAYVVSIVVAPNLHYLPRRLNGLIQLTYSLVIGYALFLTLAHARPRQVAGLFLGFSLVLLVGCLLETYGGLRPFSDHVRSALYHKGIYENDLRDLVIYHRVRPKFFASEPSSVTFCYALFTFIWLVTSRWRLKYLVYLALVAAGLFAMPGPTLLLMLLLVLPYLLFLDSRRDGKVSAKRFLGVSVVAAACAVAFFMLGPSIFQERFRHIQEGNDASFFYRVEGPALAGVDVVRSHPVAGAGLTGEPYIENDVLNSYVKSTGYSMAWVLASPSTELLINYFWLHWIYLGAIFGLLIGALLTGWFVVLGVPSPAFAWLVWAILGQASGAYVGPTCWAVLFAAGAAAMLHQRPAAARAPMRLRWREVIADLPTRLDRLSLRHAAR
ncbi:MAG TPA: hypothetical protein VFB13_13860 [Reyranella sp.]|nr:hypothetical protein [Reyranella sp.]